MVRWGFWKNRTHNLARRSLGVLTVNGTRGDCHPRRFRSDQGEAATSRAGR